jgi:hypothetical protein
VLHCAVPYGSLQQGNCVPAELGFAARFVQAAANRVVSKIALPLLDAAACRFRG